MTEQEIKELALANGFKLKEQADGSLDLNPYVYDFVAAVLAKAVPEGFVVVPTTNVHTFYQDDDEPENFCNDESEFDLLGDCLDDGDIIVVNKITSAQMPSEKFYGTWVVDASNRKFELFVSYAEAAQAIKAAQEPT